MLVRTVSENQRRVAWWEEIISGIIGQGDEWQAMGLSYFPEVLVCEAHSSVGGERFVFRAADSPKGSQRPVYRFILQYRQGKGETEAQLCHTVYGEAQPIRAGGQGQAP